LKKFNFTDLRIKKLSPPGKGLKDYLVFDNKTPYLAVRVGVGSKRYSLKPSNGSRRMKLLCLNVRGGGGTRWSRI
jgi:hypothetical protein